MFTRSHSDQQGFSMLELVVVLGILTVMTSVSLTFMGDKDEKHRYQESIVKLKAVQRNFLSVGEYQGKIVASGFLIDNGLLFDDAAAPSLKNSVEALLGVWEGSDTPVEPETLVGLSLLPFAAREVWVNTHNDAGNDEDAKKVSVVGSQLFKGVRPGLFDLSEYRDNTAVKVAGMRGAIKDAWGEEFKQTLLASEDSDPDEVTLEIEDRDYKELLSPARVVRFSENEFLFPVAGLKVRLTSAPDDTTSFKVALVSFNNEVECGADLVDTKIVEAGCWHTIKTDENNALTSTFDNMFRLTQVADPKAIYNDDDVNFKISNIMPSLVTPQKLSALLFTDSNAAGANDWSFTAPLPMQDIDLIFSSTEKISAGSHLLVVLCKNAESAWEIYSRDTSGCNVPISPPFDALVNTPIFEYLHLLPGVTPSPIVITLPKSSL